MSYESELSRKLRNVDRARAACARRKRFVRTCWQMAFGGAIALVVGTWYGNYQFGVALAVLGGFAIAGGLFSLGMSAISRDTAYDFTHEDEALADAESDYADWLTRMEESR